MRENSFSEGTRSEALCLFDFFEVCPGDAFRFLEEVFVTDAVAAIVCFTGVSLGVCDRDRLTVDAFT